MDALISFVIAMKWRLWRLNLSVAAILWSTHLGQRKRLLDLRGQLALALPGVPDGARHGAPNTQCLISDASRATLGYSVARSVRGGGARDMPPGRAPSGAPCPGLGRPQAAPRVAIMVVWRGRRC